MDIPSAVIRLNKDQFKALLATVHPSVRVLYGTDRFPTKGGKPCISMTSWYKGESSLSVWFLLDEEL